MTAKEPTLEQMERANHELGQALAATDEPAPLDPSKVKAGDTVTLTRGKAVVADEVRAVRQPHPDWFAFELSQDSKGERSRAVMSGTAASALLDAWTLTAHQPAPEPEWEPGTVAEATVKGRFGRVRVMRLHETLTDRTHHWVEESGTIPDDSHVTDVRPLVVIDPAAAREALADLVVHNNDGDPDGWVEAHESAILQAVGIEAP